MLARVLTFSIGLMSDLACSGLFGFVIWVRR